MLFVTAYNQWRFQGARVWGQGMTRGSCKGLGGLDDRVPSGMGSRGRVPVEGTGDEVSQKLKHFV